jgi:tyrosyl-tRNA synthetase
MSLSEDDLLAVFEGVPQVELPRATLEAGINLVEFLSDVTGIFPSRGEARKMVQGGGVFLNKNKAEDIARMVTVEDLLQGRYLLAQKGKKNYVLIKVS